jgi:hypothetical protein
MRQSINYGQKFKSDLRDGNLGERTLVFHYIKQDWKVIEYNNDILYDFIIEKDGVKKSYEVKTDRYEYFKGYKTGNIFIEVRCNGKPSGLQATIADYMAFLFPDDEECFLIETEKLKELMSTQTHLFTRKDRSGDLGKVVGYTINRHENRELFEVIQIKKHKFWKS